MDFLNALMLEICQNTGQGMLDYHMHSSLPTSPQGGSISSSVEMSLQYLLILYSLSIAAGTHCHKISGLKQHKYISSD